MKTALKLFTEQLTPTLNDAGRAWSLPTMIGAADAFLAAAIADYTGKMVLAITPGIPNAERLYSDLTVAAAHSPIRLLEFPPRLEGDRTTISARLRTLSQLSAYNLKPYPAVVVSPAVAIAAADVPPQSAQALNITCGSLTFTELIKNLTAFGYERIAFVEKEGDWSARGGIVDFWSPDATLPVRAEFFGSELESLRTFDPATQRSLEKLVRTTLENFDRGESKPKNPVTLFERLPADAIVLLLEHDAYHLAIPKHFRQITTGDPPPPGIPSLPFPISPLPGLTELGAAQAHHPELFNAAQKRLEHHLAAARERGEIIFELNELSAGFEIPGVMAAVAKADRVFTRSPLRLRRPTIAGNRLNDFEELEIGEYVVHVDYGIGRFRGSAEILTDGKRTEVFSIEYADGAILHVPATHAHLLSRYIGVKGEKVSLHRLDGKRWKADRLAAAKAVADLAASLLDTQARRATVPKKAYNVRPEGYAAFAAAFPYEETEDQRAAIAAIEKDLASCRPMDRLLCGDAGYGKTEVAMRAAYITAMNGKQTVVLAPTTVLAEQHFESFTSRFDATPIRIEEVSRFQSPAVHRGTFQRLASGGCDIVIGTHALLTNKITFHDLGLIIIDEEQRFGVRQKEFLKRLRATADILTLSATPIPRTLYLSMTGARDLSLLRTPPRERVAVETLIARDDDTLIKTAIENELKRGGLVFFLHNRIAGLNQIEKRIKTLVPAAKTLVAHGRMDSAYLAEQIRGFARGQTNVLISTTIISAGIDIPRANTILVDHADSFGLADLYQLRGRVGRSSWLGHAIFLLPPSGIVDSDARERLKALKRHSALGAGFNLAMRDLELRGAGNLLGAQQSGHIAAVGFALYCQLLKRTIAALKGEKTSTIVDVRIELDFIELSPAAECPEREAAFPYDYLEEEALRMKYLKHLAEATTLNEVKSIREELTDRFGQPPAPVNRLLALTEIRVLAAGRGYSELDVRNGRAVCRQGKEIAAVFELKKVSCDEKLKELKRALK